MRYEIQLHFVLLKEKNMERKVIVFGASGNTGIEICKQLSDVRILHSAFVRKGSEVKIKSQNTEFIFGDVLEISDVEKAFSTKDFTDVVIALGSKDLKALNIRFNGTKNIIDVLNQLSMKCSIHVISALGVNESWSQLNRLNKLFCKLLINSTMKDHGLQEDAVVNSSQKFHIIRPVGLRDGEATNKITIQAEGFLPHNDILRADVAKYLVDSMIADKTGFSSICKA